MAAKIKIHRDNQIGGCVTEIWTANTRILIDFGEELPGSKSGKPLELEWGESIERGKKKPAVKAVFFTHYHGDHIGRFAEAYQHADLYMSELSRDVLVNIHEYLRDNLPWLAKRKGGSEAVRLREEAEKHADALDILKETGIHQGKNRVHTFRPHEKPILEIGDIRVTPFWVDHSAADACMLLVEAGGKRILHTGDFRGHGAWEDSRKAVLEEARRLRGVDTLIIEGTMMSRQNEKTYSEEQLLDTARIFFREPRNRHTFLIVSSTNLDSISTFYQAAKENHLPMYCHNPYVERQIKTLGEYARKHWDRPGMENVERIRPWDTGQLNKMREEGFVAIIKANEFCRELVEQFEDCRPVVICSMWQGYYHRKLDKDLCAFVDACKKKKIPVYPLTDDSYGPMHTSGHASLGLIAEVIDAADPKEIRPIHTEEMGGFFRLNIAGDAERSDELKRRLNINGYRWVKDHRALSPQSLAKFLDGENEKDENEQGSHRAFIKLIMNKLPKELAFCLRGNSGNRAIVYYHNHAAFSITSTGNVEFNFDHARYLEDWRTYQDRLKKEYHYRFKNEEPVLAGNTYTIGTISMPAEQAQKLTATQLDELYTYSIKPIIDSFFRAEVEEGEKKDYFRSKDGEVPAVNQKLIEKAMQQRLFLDPVFKQLKSGYFFYDLEFSQPHAKDLQCENQPDMMGVYFDQDGKPERLVFVEVKSKKDTLYGESGVKPHVWGMERYPDWLLPIRGRDACSILDQYRKIGLIKERREPFKEEDFVRLAKEVLLIFTGADTIDALGTAREDKAGSETIAQFLSARGYEWEDRTIPQPAEIDEVKIYRKIFEPPVL